MKRWAVVWKDADDKNIVYEMPNNGTENAGNSVAMRKNINQGHNEVSQCPQECV